MKTFKLYLKKLLTYSGTIENEVTKANYHFKGNFDSTHTELLNIIKNGSRVLDIGCYDSSVAEMLMNKKNCIVDGIDEKKISNNLKLNKFFENNFNFVDCWLLIELAMRFFQKNGYQKQHFGVVSHPIFLLV